jgi:hypothetical protein
MVQRVPLESEPQPQQNSAGASITVLHLGHFQSVNGAAGSGVSADFINLLSVRFPHNLPE